MYLYDYYNLDNEVYLLSKIPVKDAHTILYRFYIKVLKFKIYMYYFHWCDIYFLRTIKYFE